MRRPSVGVPRLERLEAIVENPAIYQLAAQIPAADPLRGGRRRHYPEHMWLIYESLISVYGSARQVEAELSHPIVWRYLRDRVHARFPRQPDQWLPDAPMRRHHYLYARNRYLTDPRILRQLSDAHRALAADQARALGLMDPNGPGSWTHPDLSRMLHADGKVITPLFRAKPGDTRTDTATGEIRPLRSDPDGGLHIEGDGEAAWGTKFVLVAARNSDPHGRVILDIEWVPKPGGEAATAMNCFTRLAPLLPGAHGVVYDTALRGVHHQTLLRELGLLPINRVAAAHAGSTLPRRSDRRVEKSAYIEDKSITVDGRQPSRSTPAVARSESENSPKPDTSPLPNSSGSAPTAPKTRAASTAGTTTSDSPIATAARPSPSAFTGHPKTQTANSTVPRTSALSRPATPTSLASTRAATTPNRSTATSKTPSGSDEPTASATPDNTSTSSDTR